MNDKQNFLAVLRKSVYAPDFYAGLPAKPFSWSIRYFLTLNLILAIVFTVVFGFKAIPSLVEFVNKLGPAIVQAYPEELELVFKNGKVSSNVIEPYAIKFPEEFVRSGQNENEEDEHPLPDNMLVIDTGGSFNLEKFYEYKTAALLSGDTIAFEKENGQIQIQPLKDFPDITINRSKVYSWVSNIESLGKYLPPIAVVLIFLGSFFVLLLKLIYLLIAALLILIIVKIKNLPISYKKCYQIGLHAITAAVLLSAFLKLFLGAHLLFMVTIVTLVAAWFNLAGFKKESPTVTSPISTSPRDPAPPASAS